MKTNSLFVAAAVAGLVSVAAYADEAIDVRQTPEFEGSQTHAVVAAKRAHADATRTMGAAGASLDRASVRAEAIQAAHDGQIKSGEVGAY
jgi:hypothetical protein